jgi:hypothetical protein
VKDWTTIKQEIHDILVGLAAMRRTIYYSHLATHIQSAYIHYRAPAFAQILQDLCADEVAAGRPILGVLVVNKQTDRCGSGFFRWAAAQGFDVSDPETFWLSEFERVCNYWEDVCESS